MAELKKDGNGFEFYDELPENTKIATIEDFVCHGKKRTGMKYLILGYHWPVYQLYVVDENLKGKDIIDFIENERVFVFV